MLISVMPAISELVLPALTQFNISISCTPSSLYFALGRVDAALGFDSAGLNLTHGGVNVGKQDFDCVDYRNIWFSS